MQYVCGSLSEWLRRWTRNPLGFARAGSNPAAVAYIGRLYSGVDACAYTYTRLCMP